MKATFTASSDFPFCLLSWWSTAIIGCNLLLSKHMEAVWYSALTIIIRIYAEFKSSSLPQHSFLWRVLWSPVSCLLQLPLHWSLQNKSNRLHMIQNLLSRDITWDSELWEHCTCSQNTALATYQRITFKTCPFNHKALCYNHPFYLHPLLINTR